MTARRPTAPRPWARAWAGPLALSVAVHGAILGAAFGLNGLVEPPRPERVIPVELVFAAAPAASPANDAIAATASSSFPRKRESSDEAGSPLSRGRRETCHAPDESCNEPSSPSPTLDDPPAIAEKPAPRFAVTLPPLPRHKPPPPVAVRTHAAAPVELTESERRAADRAIARMLDDAAAKAAPPSISSVSVSPPTPALPHTGGGSNRGAAQSPSPMKGEGRRKAPSPQSTQQAARTDATGALVPPGWGAPALGNVPPAYPLAARVRGTEGRVVLRVRVSAGGAVETVTVATSSGHALLDEAARRAVAGWRFVPGRLAGVPVTASVDVPVTFRLRD